MDHTKFFAAALIAGAFVAVVLWAPISIDINITSTAEDAANEIDAMTLAEERPTNSSAPSASCDQPFIVVESMPVLHGGLASLHSKLRYPSGAKDAGLEGRVFVQFIVSETGKVQDALVLRGVDPRLDAEALRAVREITFAPGSQGGQNVCVKMSVPVTFRL